MLTSHYTTATRAQQQAADAGTELRGTVYRPRRLAAFAGLMVAAVALGGCTSGVGPTLTAADLQQDSSLAPWKVAGPTVARANILDRQQCYGGDNGLVDDCNPMSIRYNGW